MGPRPRVQATVHTPSRQPFGSALTLAASWVPTLAAQFGRVAPVPDCGEDLMEAPGVGAADQLFHSQGLHWRNRSRSGGGNDSRRKCGHRKRAGCNHQRHRVPTRNAVELTRNQPPAADSQRQPQPRQQSCEHASRHPPQDKLRHLCVLRTECHPDADLPGGRPLRWRVPRHRIGSTGVFH